MKKKLTLAILSAMTLSSCASYQYAKDVKMVSFDDDVSKGKSVGPIRGEDCVWTVFGKRLGGVPTLDRAFASARNQTSSSITDTFSHGNQVASNDQSIRYIDNMTTEHDGFNAFVVGKDCLAVKGTGYR